MYETFFGLSGNPFQLSPDPFFMFGSEKCKEALTSISHAICQRKGFVVMTGEVGTGKSLVLRCLFELWEREQIPFAYFIGPRLSTVDFLSYIAFELGIKINDLTKGNLLRALYGFLLAQYEKGLTTVLVIDEAHQMPRTVLEEIRVLSNFETAQQKLIQIVLVGQPELEKNLDSLELRSLKQRVTVRCRLEPLRADEIYHYIQRRLDLAGADPHAPAIFPAETVKAIYRYSQGIPRLVNSICDQALIAAYARRIRFVPVEIIDDVATHFRLKSNRDLDQTEEPLSKGSWAARPFYGSATETLDRNRVSNHREGPGSLRMQATPISKPDDLRTTATGPSTVKIQSNRSATVPSDKNNGMLFAAAAPVPPRLSSTPESPRDAHAAAGTTLPSPSPVRPRATRDLSCLSSPRGDPQKHPRGDSHHGFHAGGEYHSHEKRHQNRKRIASIIALAFVVVACGIFWSRSLTQGTAQPARAEAQLTPSTGKSNPVPAIKSPSQSGTRVVSPRPEAKPLDAVQTQAPQGSDRSSGVRETLSERTPTSSPPEKEKSVAGYSTQSRAAPVEHGVAPPTSATAQPDLPRGDGLAAISRDLKLPSGVGEKKKGGSQVLSPPVIEGTKLESVELPVEVAKDAARAITPAISPPIRPAILSRPKFVLNRTLKGHSGWVTAVAFSSDGERLASGSWDHTVKFWDVSTGRELGTIGKKMNEVQALALSRDGHSLAVENSSDTVTLWDTTSGREIRSLPSDRPQGILGSNWVYSIAFSPDDHWLASGVDDKTIRLWDVRTGRMVRDLTGLRRSVMYVAFSPDGQWLASGDDDKSIGIWDVSTGQEIQRLRGHKKSVYAVVFSPNGRLVASASADKTIKVWDVLAGREIHTLTGHENLVTSLAFSPDGRWLISGSWDKTIKIWDADTGQELQTLTGDGHTIYAVACDSSGRWLASGSEDGTISLWRFSGDTSQTGAQ